MFNSGYIIYLVNLVALFAILGLSYNLLVGFTGLGNLGHPAFFLVGAYTTALLTVKAGWPLPVAWALGTLAGMITGALLSLVTRKARGDVVSVLTLFFLITVITVTLNWTTVTRGALGIPGIPRPTAFQTPEQFLLLTVFAFILVYGIVWKITRSPFGRVLGAVRDDELAAATLGKNVFKARVVAFLIAGALAGFGGGLFGMFFRFVDPGSFYFPMLISVLTIVYIGGLASLPGTILGAVVVILLPEILRFLPLNPEVVGALRQIIFSALVLIVIIWRPKGMLGKVEL
ncbi:branched-chain amino acid ABC transporter permease [Candidatus Uhrbacteria bacterium]|nr:branched-chain amino acid ABC transporter permease [Candidatus Uhrbacteria bacterium]